MKEFEKFYEEARKIVKRDYSNQIDDLINRCIKENILKDYMIQNRAEVKEMIIDDYANNLIQEALTEISKREGIEEINIEIFRSGVNEN